MSELPLDVAFVRHSMWAPPQKLSPLAPFMLSLTIPDSHAHGSAQMGRRRHVARRRLQGSAFDDAARRRGADHDLARQFDA